MRRILFVPLLLAACQSYDFRHITAVPVTLVTKRVDIKSSPLTPNIMIVQDTSGSMCEPIAANVALTDGGFGAGDCAYDVSQSKAGLVATNLQKVLTALDPTNNTFNLGLLSFPSGAVNDAGASDACGVETTPLFPIANAVTSIPQISAWYANMVSIIKGGTPTAASLQAAASDPSLKNTDPRAQNYIILITDGLPNCNDKNPCVLDPANNLWTDGQGHGCESPTYEQAFAASYGEPVGNAQPPPQCQCSIGSCPDPDGGSVGVTCCTVDPEILTHDSNYMLEIQYGSRECLDQDNSVNTVAQLYASNIKTYVIGLGYDFVGLSGQVVLTKMAQAGAGGQLDAGYFPADNEAQLYSAINGIIQGITIACTYSLDAVPANPRLIEVQIDSDPYLTLDNQSNGFVYDSVANTVSLVGSACAKAKDGLPHHLTIKALSQ